MKRGTAKRGTPKRAGDLSHYRSAKRGGVQMVDVSAKPVTARTARARGFIRIGRVALAAIRRRTLPKGDPLEIARIAGIAAAKRTSEMIPLCHPLALTHVDVTTRLRHNGIEIEGRVNSSAQTGVEMEALAAVAVAALTVYDMAKALDRSMEITGIYLVEKTGGQRGDYRRPVGKRRDAGRSRTR
ncbi:MAG TPA: cyclic pyranopterin monophosphate synthase MoaC [Candidatus Acidoferrales bacterium]|nr:cyclic pyranopterin monophosphate synthase MoaC [Candidatus Acidoferrales bacterium]